ncbi:MAG TPA: NADP-dependent oxidoreductase [Patescibacteria group bacterium]
MPAGLVAQAPRNIPLGTAAAVPLAALTAWGALIAPEYADIQPDETILIHGAAGGVGCFAVQLAKWRKAKVIATASSYNAEFLKGIGADEVIDYKTERFEDVVKNVDVVADLVGGDLIERSYQVIKPQGRLMSVVALPDQKIAETHQVRATFVPGFRSKNALNKISELIDTGIIKVVISEELPLADAAVK